VLHLPIPSGKVICVTNQRIFSSQTGHCRWRLPVALCFGDNSPPATGRNSQL